MCNRTEKEQQIKELQNLAENILALKQEHRQKRPIVIEFSGSPKAGKTSCINSLELFLKRNGFTVKIIQERASVCPVSDKQSPMFNIWTACMTLSGLIGTIEDTKSEIDVLILDRGIFDALCWFEWLSKNKKMEKKQRDLIEKFFLMYDWTKWIDIVFAFSSTPEVSIQREYANLLTNKFGSIMNAKVLSEYLEAIQNTIKNKKQYFHRILEIETSKKDQNKVGYEVTSKTLETLKELLMEKIGYIERNEALNTLLSQKNVFEYNEISVLELAIKFNLREQVEKQQDLLQPIPVAIITNKERNKILVIKKNKNATSNDSPEKDKLLLYIGGHSRYEDSIEDYSTDFISVCRSTLKRELKEEIGISIALNEIEPFLLYTPTNERSKKHIAVCFLIELDENGLKLHLDSNELITNKGKSKSGKFLSFEEICTEKDLEDWSQIILEYCFHIKYKTSKQLALFDKQ